MVPAQGELVVPETVRLPCVCAVIRWCPDHQYQGALLPTTLPVKRTVGLDNPQASDRAKHMLCGFDSHCTFFFKFGNDRENEIALCEFILFVQMFRSCRLTWVTGMPPAPITQQWARVREGSWSTTQAHGRQMCRQTARTQVTGTFSGSTGLLWG